MNLALSILACVCLSAAVVHGQEGKKAEPAGGGESGLVVALRFSQRFGEPEALTPARDRGLKLALIEALRADKAALTWKAVREIFERRAFLGLAGEDERISVREMERMLEKTSTPSRDALRESVRRHADLLTTQFDLIEEPHRAAAEELVAWMSANYQPDKPLNVIIVCTGNSRRSMLGSTMGNIAAAYYGMPNIRFYSGGTTPSAFNPRTVATLREIGVEIEPTGKEAPRGDGGEPNPIYRVRWGQEMETVEFSKTYGDARNPQTGFAALLVCTQADAACPTVRGAAKRLSVPYLDPKDYDGSSFEAAKYAERRDDIGRFMLSVLMQVQRRNMRRNGAD